jgi:hypothetical protein
MFIGGLWVFFCWLKIHNRNKRPKGVKKGVLHFNYLWNHRANWIQTWKKCSLNSPLMFGFFVWFEIHKNKQKGQTGCFLFLYVPVECLFFYQSFRSFFSLCSWYNYLFFTPYIFFMAPVVSKILWGQSGANTQNYEKKSNFL